jgi:hypothetical protein
MVFCLGVFEVEVMRIVMFEDWGFPPPSPELRQHDRDHGTVFPVFPALEESGSSLFSLLFSDCLILRGSRPVLSCENWKSRLLTLSGQNCVTDRPVSESESNFVRPKFRERSVGHKIFTVTPTRPFSHERTGREPRSMGVSQKLIVKTVSFQILPKQWKQWTQFYGLHHFVPHQDSQTLKPRTQNLGP